MFSLPLPSTRAATEARADGSSVPTVVITSRPPRYRLDFVDQLVGDDSEGRAPKDVTREFRTDPFRLDGADVIHLTDSAAVIGACRSDRQRIRRAKRFTRMLRRRRIALVRTVHGAEPDRTTSPAEAIIDDAATAVTSLVPLPTADGKQALVVAHSHLRDRFLGFPRATPVEGRLLLTAMSTLPPSTLTTLKVFGVADLPGWTLHIAGSVPAEARDAFAHSLAEHVDSVSVRDELLSDAASVEEICRAELVIVPGATTYPSQAMIMLALSLDRPVLVEDSAHAAALAEEVGPSWVRRHPGPLTAHALRTALAAFRADPPTGRPDLDARAPNVISARYSAVYLAAAAAR